MTNYEITKLQQHGKTPNRYMIAILKCSFLAINMHKFILEILKFELKIKLSIS